MPCCQRSGASSALALSLLHGAWGTFPLFGDADFGFPMAGLENEPRFNAKRRPAGWLGLGFCIVCFVASATFGQTSRPSPAVNPHWSSDGCGKCHELRGGVAFPIASESVTPLCVSCHDGARASDEIHPINTRMEGRSGPNPGWPT